MTTHTNEIVSRLVGLIPSSNDAEMWREHWGQLLLSAAESDDLSLLRAGKLVDAFETDFQAFAKGFPGVELTEAPKGGFYKVTVALANFDREARCAVLRAYADRLRMR